MERPVLAEAFSAKLKRIALLVVMLTVALTACGKNDTQIVEGEYLVSRADYSLLRNQFGKWQVLTPLENSESLIMVGREGSPVISANLLAGVPGILVHDPRNAALSSVEIYDNHQNGVYDRLVLYQQDGSNGFIDAKLVDGRWQINESLNGLENVASEDR